MENDILGTKEILGRKVGVTTSKDGKYLEFYDMKTAFKFKYKYPLDSWTAEKAKMEASGIDKDLAVVIENSMSALLNRERIQVLKNTTNYALDRDVTEPLE